ncbi:hypothetical protein C8R43DRAFT_1128636 [Mycena crocata]|nr:hypothetical protein C8R43DRAFT_1128636 [Mycena crocata]
MLSIWVVVQPIYGLWLGSGPTTGHIRCVALCSQTTKRLRSFIRSEERKITQHRTLRSRRAAASKTPSVQQTLSIIMHHPLHIIGSLIAAAFGLHAANAHTAFLRFCGPQLLLPLHLHRQPCILHIATPSPPACAATSVPSTDSLTWHLRGAASAPRFPQFFGLHLRRWTYDRLRCCTDCPRCPSGHGFDDMLHSAVLRPFTLVSCTPELADMCLISNTGAGLLCRRVSPILGCFVRL